MQKSILLMNLAATLTMVGLIWFVQVVHYPLFVHVSEAQFPDFERDHQRLTTWVVAPLMLTELVTAAALIFWRPAGVGLTAPVVGFGLVVLIWLITYLVQVPQHAALSVGYSEQLVRQLVTGNWWRTAAWSARGLLVLLMIVQTWKMRA
ncbi:MAG: hypothetical protein OES79_17190 [Planctomycetota bacterium]|nr:hypothetical protein [Planctomycetota bacterium]